MQEKELLMSQNEWMTQELECKSEQLIQLRKERSSTVGELESQLATRDEAVRIMGGCFRVGFNPSSGIVCPEKNKFN